MPLLGSFTSQSLNAITKVAVRATLKFTLNNPNAYGTSASDFFGYSVAMSDNYAIVGVSSEDDAGGIDSGKAYIYNATTGALLHTLNNPNPYSTSVDDQFGLSVAISDNYAIVGARNEDDAGGTESGKVYIYNVITGALVHTLNNPNAYSTSAGDRFGRSVAISGNYVIIGAPFEDDAGGTESGKAYIYNVITGALVHTLNNPNAYGTSASDYFGVSVAISDNYAILGVYSEGDAGGSASGKAYIYNVITGALVHTLNNPNAMGTSYNDQFGGSVGISGNYAIVGAEGEQDGSYIGQFPNSGKAYIFNVTTGALLYTLNNPNITFGTDYANRENDYFANTVGISGNYAVVGAWKTNTNTAPFADTGRAYIFDVTTGILVHTLKNPNAYGTTEGDQFGYPVAISGNNVIVAAFLEDEAGGVNSGKAYIYRLNTLTVVPGSQAFTTPGTHSWTAPANVTSVSVVAVGGSGPNNGLTSGASGGYGSGGGGLGWRNNVPVVPGQSYTVKVGTAGEDSYFISTATVKGGGGTAYAGGTFTGDGGGNGGNSGTVFTYDTYGQGGSGGGGAGGYTGNGGAGGNGGNGYGNYGQGTAGSDGAGGGGGGSGGSGYGSAGAGGVGLFGQGANGTGGVAGTNGGGGGGSGGSSGGSSGGGLYGGGTGSYGNGGPLASGVGTGAVRIVWGVGRSFPSTNVNY